MALEWPTKKHRVVEAPPSVGDPFGSDGSDDGVGGTGWA